ncbi:MAG: flagellar motor switch protein FliN [Gammaproteobacteria bacterium]|nr:flagellar motor switch protein FliN [Gammaproteobacteria bacterium]
MSIEESGAQPEVEDQWAEAMQEEQQTRPSVAVAERAEIEPLTDDGSRNSDAEVDINIDVILDIPVTIAMEIGRTLISIRNLLQLNQGSVVELDRLAGEPLDVMVNGTLIAHGEVVVVNEKFGIRLTDIISPSERIKNIK